MLPGNKTVGVVIPAAGRGSRMKHRMPKQFMALCGKPILLRTLEPFQASAVIDFIIVVAGRADVAKVRRMVLSARISKVRAVVPGGSVRQESVWNGLRELQKHSPDVVLVHDAVRPFISTELIEGVARVAWKTGACIPAVPLTDTIKACDGDAVVKSTLPREHLWAAQTPQGFRNELLCRAFTAAARSRFRGTDEAGIVERLGARVRVIMGTRENLKITTPDDILLAETLVRRKAGKR